MKMKNIKIKKQPPTVPPVRRPGRRAVVGLLACLARQAPASHMPLQYFGLIPPMLTLVRSLPRRLLVFHAPTIRSTYSSLPTSFSMI